MGEFVDTSIGILVILAFVYLMYVRLKIKFPGMSEALGDFFPFMKNRPSPIEKVEKLKQTWSEQRTKL